MSKCGGLGVIITPRLADEPTEQDNKSKKMEKGEGGRNPTKSKMIISALSTYKKITKSKNESVSRRRYNKL